MKNFFALKNKVLTLLVISLSFVVLAFTFSLPIGVRAETAEITDYSVTLEKDIKLNYFVKGVTDSAYMTFSIDGSEPMTVTEKTATETGYKFTFNGITPQLVGKEYTVKLYENEQATEAVAQSTSSIANYLAAAINRGSANEETDGSYIAFKQLAANILSYSVSAQNYVGITEATSSNAMLSTYTKNVADFTDLLESGKAEVALVGSKDDGVKPYAISLSLDNNVILNAKFEVSGEEYAAYASVNGTESEVKTVVAADGKVVASVPLCATELSANVVIWLQVGEQKKGYSVSVKASDYLGEMALSENKELSTIVKSVYNYGKAAEAYVAVKNMSYNGSGTLNYGWYNGEYGYNLTTYAYTAKYEAHTFINGKYAAVFSYKNNGTGTDKTGANSSFRISTAFNSDKSLSGKIVTMTYTFKNISDKALSFETFLRSGGKDTSTFYKTSVELNAGEVKEVTLITKLYDHQTLNYYKILSGNESGKIAVACSVKTFNDETDTVVEGAGNYNFGRQNTTNAFGKVDDSLNAYGLGKGKIEEDIVENAFGRKYTLAAVSGTDKTKTNALFRVMTMKNKNKSITGTLVYSFRNYGKEALSFYIYLRSSGSDTSAVTAYHVEMSAEGGECEVRIPVTNLGNNNILTYFRNGAADQTENVGNLAAGSVFAVSLRVE